MAKMDPKIVALCAAAIGIIYSAGYVVTEPAVLAQNSPPTAIASTQNASDSNAPVTSKSEVKTPKAPSKDSGTSVSSAHSAAVTAQGQYKDGTYTGQGSNRIGTVGVAVTVKQGKIISCEITDCSTHYPVSAINPVLPNEVVSRQSGNVDIVSGATRSTQDFRSAVQEALAQAKV